MRLHQQINMLQYVVHLDMLLTVVLRLLPALIDSGIQCNPTAWYFIVLNVTTEIHSVKIITDFLCILPFPVATWYSH